MKNVFASFEDNFFKEWPDFAITRFAVGSPFASERI